MKEATVVNHFSIADAILVATDAHMGQVDMSGSDYIHHCLGVMALCDGEQDQIVAVLHDVVEDTDLTIAGLLAQGLSPELAVDVNAITKRRGEKLDAYIARVNQRPRARRVKIRDVVHNLSRMGDLCLADQERLKRKYVTTIQLLVEGKIP